MNLEGLSKKLKELNIPEDNYYLHGLFGSTDDSDKLALTIKRGEFSREYEIYYKERGQKNSIQTFQIEAEACEYFLKKITPQYL